MITKYGYDVFFSISATCIVVLVLAFLFVEPRIFRYGTIAVVVAFFVFTAYFFRDPERVTPQGDSFVICPADGKVIGIKKVYEPEYIKGEAWQICVFMSPLNVHVNRNPIDGTVRHTRYVHGEYFAAFEDKASEKNEQMIVGIEGKHGKVVFKQIAGFVARRIVCTLQEGDSVKAGNRFGMIKFGSRVDVFVPVTAAVQTKLGEKTKAGETVLAEFAKNGLE
jgi:phosphatidylserine decarboxylase